MTGLRKRLRTNLQKVRVVVREVALLCPQCGEALENPEGDPTHGECVSAKAGIATCTSCRQKLLIPDLSRVFRRITRLEWPTYQDVLREVD